MDNRRILISKYSITNKAGNAKNKDAAECLRIRDLQNRLKQHTKFRAPE